MLNQTNKCAELKVKRIESNTPFADMLALQQNLQDRLGTQFDFSRSFHEIAKSVIYWRHCLQDELSEVHDWAPFSSEADLQEARMEVIDAWHFANNIALELSISAEELETCAKAVSEADVAGMTPKDFEVSISTALKTVFEHLPWKTWKTYSDVDLAKAKSARNYVEPMLQVFSLLQDYAAWFGLSVTDVHSYYHAKHLENHARQDRGY